jgi:hypothetical protein
VAGTRHGKQALLRTRLAGSFFRESVFLRVMNFNDFLIFHGSGFPYQPFNLSTYQHVDKFIGL